MNTRISTARREEGGVDIRIPQSVDQITIVRLDEQNEKVPLQEPQVSLKPQVPPLSQDPFVEGDMTKEDLRASLMNLTKLMMAQAHVVNNNFVSQANQGV